MRARINQRGGLAAIPLRVLRGIDVTVGVDDVTVVEDTTITVAGIVLRQVGSYLLEILCVLVAWCPGVETVFFGTSWTELATTISLPIMTQAGQLERVVLRKIVVSGKPMCYCRKMTGRYRRSIRTTPIVHCSGKEA